MHHNQPPSQNRDPFLLQVQGIKEDIYICVKASYTYIIIKTTKQLYMHHGVNLKARQRQPLVNQKPLVVDK